jgi:hypothetical protein
LPGTGFDEGILVNHDYQLCRDVRLGDVVEHAFVTANNVMVWPA